MGDTVIKICSDLIKEIDREIEEIKVKGIELERSIRLSQTLLETLIRKKEGEPKDDPQH